jgi:hypothetical protein
MRAVADGLELGPGLRRKLWARGAEWVEDVDRLTPLVEPLPVADPSMAAQWLSDGGGCALLAEEEAQAAVRAWGMAHRTPEVLRWFSLAVSAAMAAYRQGILSQHEYTSIMRCVPVLAMSGFLPWSEEMWGDVSSVLGARVHDTPDMLRCYRQALRHGDQETLLAVDTRVCADPDWGPWACAFPGLLAEAARPQRVATLWEFPESASAGENASSVLDWLFRRD